MDRKLNYLFGFLLVILFISAANTAQQWNVLLGILLSSAFALSAFLLQRLTLDGMFAVITAGTFILGFGGWWIALVVLFFFVSSTVITKKDSRVQEDEELHNGRRNGLQVWANGFWLMSCLVLAVIFNSDIFILGALAAVAVATADTWATELGSRASGATYLITNFSTVPPGTNGGVRSQRHFSRHCRQFMYSRSCSLRFFTTIIHFFKHLFSRIFRMPRRFIFWGYFSKE
ncbi:MAG: DUF92 domain-containing protein [Fodinibius sp.]|nr:DUF92 domain-containing protein [Fodinibius sp.]